MLVLGIDPGTAETGYGVIRCEIGRLTLVKHGSIKTSTKQENGQRLLSIYTQVMAVFDGHQPEVVAIESLFFSSNAKSASAVGQAIGVTKLAAAQKNIAVFEYPPLRVKMNLVNRGRAEKSEVQSAVRKLLRLKKIPRPNHAADALAVAICHWQTIFPNERKPMEGGEAKCRKKKSVR